MLHFNNDYMRGAHPEILGRLCETNMEQQPGYGHDVYCHQAAQAILAECNYPQGKVWLLSGGTQTNAVMIDAMLTNYQGVIATTTSHINVHEAGAIEASGHKVLTIEECDGKITAPSLKRYLDTFFSDMTWQHMVIPGMVYISQPTELGTLYSKGELEEISNVCQEYGLKLYIDGARLIYALQAPGNDLNLPDIARLTDAFYIGGTKAGTLFGEAVVVREPEKYPHLFTLIKRHGALLAKGRLLGIQFLTLFSNDLYKRIGQNAVTQAMKIKDALLARGWKPIVDSPTNQQIFTIPNSELTKLGNSITFDVWGSPGEVESTVRFTTDWSTSDEETRKLIDLITGTAE